jgi:NADH-quinone oxidoreductase subunit L
VAAITAVMTAFYMTRLLMLTFFGKERFEEVHGHGHGHDEHGHGGVHESPWVMVAPLVVLAILSAIGGFMGVPHMSWLEHWLEPIMGHHVTAAGADASMEWVLMGLSVAGGLFGMLMARNIFSDLPRAASIRESFAGLHRVLQNKWYVDEGYEALLVRPLVKLSQFLWKQFDVAVIDRLVVGLGRASAWTGETIRTVQTGSTQAYALVLVLGLLFSLGYMIYGLV